MPVCALEVELHLPAASSLKAKRATIRPIIDRVRHRLRLSVGEVGDQDRHHQARLTIAAVGATPAQVADQLDRAERLVWSAADVEVVRCDRVWLETEQ